MIYKYIENDIIVEDISDFDIGETLECGQCFRYKKNKTNDYSIVAFNKFLRMVQDNNKIIFYNTSIVDFENIWIQYFDLDRDYSQIKSILSRNDKILSKAVSFKPGVRLLKQDIWECLISFIISQNKQISHIRQIVNNISCRYGNYICSFNDNEYYTFPTVEQLSKVSEQDLRECKLGFRAPYIIDACKKITTKEIDLNKLGYLPTEEAKKQLLKIKGVGNKISDCVLLFSLSRYEVFPIDVWVKRIMEYFYLEKDTKLNDIQSYAKEKFKNKAGFAQQYLFYYAREKKIRKK